MITVKIDEDDFLDMLMDHLIEFWTKDGKKANELFEQMYRNKINDGVFEGSIVDIADTVDDDYVNYTRVIYKGEDGFDKLLDLYHNDQYDVSTEDVGYDYIEAVTYKEDAILVRQSR